MPYAIVDIELTDPLPNLTSLRGQSGAAFICRRKGRLVGFLLKSFSTGGGLCQDELARLIAREVGRELLRESIREELSPGTVGSGFPSMTVAICTKDRPHCLRRCLQSLAELKERGMGEASDFGILVIDNAPSDDQTKQIVRQFPDVDYAAEPRRGLNFARNRALQEAEGELVAYLDDDVIVDSGWLRGLQEAWSENSDAAAFTGQVLPMELETEAQILFEQRGGFRRGFEKLRYTSSGPDDEGFLYPCCTGIFGVGCNMAFRRKAMLEIGGFDEALDTGQDLPGGGDHDIFYRLIRAGHVLVYEPTYLVFHQHRLTLEQLRDQFWSWGLSVMTVVSKSYRMDRPLRSRWRKLTVGWFYSHLNELVKALCGRHVLPPLFLFWEICGGIVGLCGEYKRSMRRIERIRREHP